MFFDWTSLCKLGNGKGGEREGHGEFHDAVGSSTECLLKERGGADARRSGLGEGLDALFKPVEVVERGSRCCSMPKESCRFKRPRRETSAFSLNNGPESFASSWEKLVKSSYCRLRKGS